MIIEIAEIGRVDTSAPGFGDGGWIDGSLGVMEGEMLPIIEILIGLR